MMIRQGVGQSRLATLGGLEPRRNAPLWDSQCSDGSGFEQSLGIHECGKGRNRGLVLTALKFVKNCAQVALVPKRLDSKEKKAVAGQPFSTAVTKISRARVVAA